MEPSKRRNFILDQLENEGKVTIDELSVELDVSMMTIRRDLDQLESEGRVIRVHGGAVLPRPLISETSFLEKEIRKVDQKRQIVKKAFSYIQEGQTLILDSGTTTLELAKLLKHSKNITIITNDIKIASELLESDLKVIVTGGELQNDIGALFGSWTQHFLKDIHVDIFFLGAHAVDLQAGVTSPTHEKSSIKQLMIQAAENTWLLADSSKLNHKSFAKVCRLEELTGFITDNDISDYEKSRYSESVDLMIVSSG